MTYPLRFGVRDGHAKPYAGGDNLFTLPDIFLQLERMLCAPIRAEVTAEELNRLLFVGKRLADKDILSRQQRTDVFRGRKRVQQRFNLLRTPAFARLKRQFAAGAGIQLANLAFHRRDPRATHAQFIKTEPQQ